ncbi:MAG: GAF domain-containing protein [Candidatus Latescibacteria bacterium]|nr:GAF domain-containing protein [Candidatus Latescibacterota bacterium]
MDLEALERRLLEAEALARAIAAVTSEVDIDQVLQTIVEQAQQVVGAERGTLFLYDEAEGALIPRAQVGHEWQVYRQLRLQPGEAVSGRVFVSGESTLYDHRLGLSGDAYRPVNQSLLHRSLQNPGGAGAVAPLKIGGRILGTLAVNTGQRLCTARDLFLLEQLAGPAALAIERTQHLRALEQETAERKRAEEELHLNLSLQQIRNQVLQMQQVADWEGVVRAIDHELGKRVDFSFASIQFIDQQAGTFCYYTTAFAPEDWPLQGHEHLPLPPSLKQVIATGQLLYRRTRAEIESYQDGVGEEARSVVDVPFPGGTLAMNSIRENAFSDRDLQILEGFAQVVHEGYQRLMDLEQLAQTRQQLEHRARESEALAAAISVLALTSEVEEVLQVVVQQAQGLVSAEHVTLFLFDAAEGALVPRAEMGHDWQTYQHIRLLPGEDTSGKVYSSGKAAFYAYATGGMNPELRPENQQLLAQSARLPPRHGGAVPLRLDGEVMGVLSVGSTNHRCTQRDLEVLERLGEQAMLAIQRAQDLEKLEEEIDEHRQTAEALRQANTYSRSLLEASLDPLVTISPEGKITDANHATEIATGYTRAELLGTDFSDYFTEPDQARGGYQQVFLAGLVRDYPLELRHRDGPVTSVLYNASVFRDTAGAVIGVFAAARDITARKRIEKELIQIQRLRAVGELSAGVCHNLNNLLSGVLTPGELLRMSSNDPKTQRLAGLIVEAGTRAAELVHRLHQSVRGGPAQPPTPVALNQTIDKVVQLTQPRWKDQPEQKGLAIEVKTELAELPLIKATPSELHDLLTNLLINAVDALPAGGQIHIRTALDGAFVRLDFSDTGIGMDEETRLRVFEPFFTTKATVGTGLGLSTLHNSVTQWGGKVSVASAPGQGTTFTLRFPVWQEAAPAAGAPDPAAPARPGQVLIIDDDQMIGKVLKEALGARHQVEIHTDGKQALAQLQAGQYDVAILDLGMPGISGDQVARRMQEVDPAMARILFSGWVLEADDPRRQLFDLAIQKPLRDLRAFEETVAQAIALRDRRAAGVSAGAAPP